MPATGVPKQMIDQLIRLVEDGNKADAAVAAKTLAKWLRSTGKQDVVVERHSLDFLLATLGDYLDKE